MKKDLSGKQGSDVKLNQQPVMTIGTKKIIKNDFFIWMVISSEN
jgi:hypothetical protein